MGADCFVWIGGFRWEIYGPLILRLKYDSLGEIYGRLVLRLKYDLLADIYGPLVLRLNYDSLGEIYGPLVLRLNYDSLGRRNLWTSCPPIELSFARRQSWPSYPG